MSPPSTSCHKLLDPAPPAPLGIDMRQYIPAHAPTMPRRPNPDTATAEETAAHRRQLRALRDSGRVVLASYETLLAPSGDNGGGLRLSAAERQAYRVGVWYFTTQCDMAERELEAENETEEEEEGDADPEIKHMKQFLEWREGLLKGLREWVRLGECS